MRRISNLLVNPGLWLIFGLVLAAGLKAWLVAGNWLPFNSDEAVVALMARHILQGARPIFFYGQAYMGSLDAFLVAGGFAVIGEQVWVIRLVQSLLYLGFLGTTALLGREVFGSWAVGILAVLLLAIPTVNVTLYSTVSLGGYGEALLIGNLVLLCVLKIRNSWKADIFPGPVRWWALYGFLSGLGLWALGLSLVYSLPAAGFLILMAWASYKKTQSFDFRSLGTALLVTILGGLIGSLPWWVFAIQNGLSRLLVELSGGAIAGVEGLPWGAQIVRHLLNFFLFGGTAMLGMRPPWDVRWLGLPLLPFVLVFWMAVVVFIFKSLKTRPWYEGKVLLAGVLLTLAAGFIFTPFGADPSGRYFLPMAAPLALFAADMILGLRSRFGVWAFGLAALLMVYQLWGTLESAFRFPPGITTQFDSLTQIDHRYDAELIDFLSAHGEKHGYGNYWVAYPLAFLSEEELIFTPRLPYHLDFRYTERDNRYPLYNDLVEQSDKIAYITTRHPALDQSLREAFQKRGAAWQEAQIGDYHIFYGLTKPIRPSEIGLGETTAP